jgi:hypothetical protein
LGDSKWSGFEYLGSRCPPTACEDMLRGNDGNYKGRNIIKVSFPRRRESRIPLIRQDGMMFHFGTRAPFEGAI